MPQMHHTHSRARAARRLITLAGAAMLPAFAAADVTQYATARYVSYTQSSDSPPTTPEFWLFSALVSTDTNYEIQTSTVSFGDGPTTHNLYEAIPNLYYYNSALYSDEAQFLLDYPETVYTISVDRGFGPESGDLYMPADLYCPQIPAFTGDTHSRLQAYDTSLAFDATINGFTFAPGANSGWTYVSVVQNGVPGAIYTIVLEPWETTFQIPAGLLLPGTGYSIGVTYFNQTLTPDAGFGNAASGAEFYRGTGAYFTTLESCDRFVDEFEVGVPCIGNGQSCGNTFDVTFDTCGLLMAEFFIAPTHCSPVELRFILDGGLVYTTATLNASDYTGVLDFGPVAPGPHTLSIEAIGSEGGCNVGILESWGGTLRLHRCAAPTELDGPYDGTILCGSDGTSFRVTATGGGPYTYQWEAQLPGDPGVWITLADGDVPDVGAILGAATDTVYITNPAGSGLSFRCIVTNGCSATTSYEAALVLQDCNPCPADFNQDGGIDGADVEAFFFAWEAGDPTSDVNYDGGIDGADVETFFAAWEAGGC